MYKCISINIYLLLHAGAAHCLTATQLTGIADELLAQLELGITLLYYSSTVHQKRISSHFIHHGLERNCMSGS
jgi:hypothetical protein